MKMKSWTFAMAAFAILVSGCQSGVSSVPDLRVEAFTGQGKFDNLKDLKGRVVVLDFWATWCGPCRESMPHVAAIYEELKSKGLEVWGVTSEERPVIAKFFGSQRLPYPIYLDGDLALNKAFNVQALPTMVVIDRHGNIAFQGHPEDPKAREAIDKTLAAG